MMFRLTIIFFFFTFVVLADNKIRRACIGASCLDETSNFLDTSSALPEQMAISLSTPMTMFGLQTYTLSISGGSGTGAVSYSVLVGSPFCSVSGDILTAQCNPGSCSIRAEKASDGTYTNAFATSDPITVMLPNSMETVSASVNAGSSFSIADGASACDGSSSLSVEVYDASGQEYYLNGLTFSNDGRKMYVVGHGNDEVFEYTLSTPFDITTTSYNASFYIGSEQSNPEGLTFNNDGTKMFIIGRGNWPTNIFEYTLSTGFDITTASYSGNSLATSSAEPPGYGLRFSSDGLKMFFLGQINDRIYKYSLTSPFDLSTATYDGLSDSYSLLSPVGITSGHDLFFSNDGTKLFVVDVIDKNFHSFSFSVPYDFSTVVYEGITYWTGASNPGAVNESAPTAVYFSNDGSKMFYLGFSGHVQEVSFNCPYGSTEVSAGELAPGTTNSVTQVRTGSVTGMGTEGTIGSGLIGTYGELTVNANGSYSYNANQAAALALSPGATATDSFNILLDNCTTKIINITVTGV